jgi:LmbE family N-acetylglucosaminyl deacetylase
VVGGEPIGFDRIDELGRLVGIWAHPDDETYLVGGLMAALVARGHAVTSVSATAGEAGGGPPDAVARLRRRELAQALAVLGVDDHVVLGHPDGGCDAVELDAAVAGVVAVLERVRPDTVVTFGPDGATGHPDHRAVSRWVDAAVARTRSGPGRPIRLLHVTHLAEDVARFADVHAAYEVFEPGLPSTTPVADTAVHLELTGALLERKVRALEAHASQTTTLVTALGRDRYASWVSHETFIDARPR